MEISVKIRFLKVLIYAVIIMTILKIYQLDLVLSSASLMRYSPDCNQIGCND